MAAMIFVVGRSRLGGASHLLHRHGRLFSGQGTVETPVSAEQPDRTHDGRKYRMLNVIDEFTRECLAIV